MDPIRPTRGRSRGRPPALVIGNQSVPSQGVRGPRPVQPTQAANPSMPPPAQPVQEPRTGMMARHPRPMPPRPTTTRAPRPALTRPSGAGDGDTALGPGSMQEVN